MSFALILGHPVTSIALTLLAYAIAVILHRRWRWIPPIVVACLPLVALLLLCRESYATYDLGGNYLTWMLGPATVGLAVPMYRNGKTLRRSLPVLALIVLAGSVVGMITAGLTAWLLGAPLPVVMSAVPKSVTTPIAIEVCRELNGIPQITIALVILAGVLGASFGRPLLKLAGVSDDRAIGAAIGTASHDGANPAFLAEAHALGAAIAATGLRLVYGGANVGLMGLVADAALAGGAKVIGVLPAVLAGREIAHAGLTALELAPTMHERKARMVELADAFLVLPGGYGTLDEMLEAVTWAQLGLHAKPVILINTAGYWDGLLAFLDSTVAAGFLKQQNRDLLHVAANAKEALEIAAQS